MYMGYPLMGQSVLRTAQGIKVNTENNCVGISCFSPSIVRVMKYPRKVARETVFGRCDEA